MALRAVFAPFFALAFLCLAVQGEYCYSYYDGGYGLYCDYGCCGSYYDQYCCAYTPGVAVIIGIVIGCLSLIAIVVTIICCIIKSQGKTGRVVQPNANRPPNQPNVTVIYRAGEQPGPAYGMQPMGGQPANPNYGFKPTEYPPPPPPYYSDPAYPPGAVPGASNPAGTNSNPFGPPTTEFPQAPASTSAAPRS